MLTFLQLYLAHLVADFILQPAWVATGQRRGSAVGHGLFFAASACAIVNLDLGPRALAAIATLAFLHIGFDYARTRFSKDGWIAFGAEQVGHLLLVALASVWLSAEGWVGATRTLRTAATSKILYLYLSAYVAVVFGGGALVQRVTNSFLAKIQMDVAVRKPGLPSAGKYIGWVERFLILTFVVGGFGEAVGFLLAAKALARYPEIKEDTKGHFAEYFLIGTLASVGLALIGGLIVRRAKGLL